MTFAILAALAQLNAPICIVQDGTTRYNAVWVVGECQPEPAPTWKLVDTPPPQTAPLKFVPTDADLIHGLVWDTARVGLGAAADLYSTAYTLRRNPAAREANPLGFNAEARVALKVGMAAGTVLAAHELRRRGHPGWAKWGTRAVMAVQIGVAVHNIRQARR